MYAAKAFRQSEDEAWKIADAAPFAVIVTHGADGMRASHVPMLRDGPSTLIGHLARANPQGQDLASGEALCIFSGIHAAISPTWYATDPAVPTWDYMAAHFYGTVETVEQPDALFELLDRLSDRFEKDSNWRFGDQPEAYRTAMLRGVTGFRLHVSRIEAIHKLSQNRSEADRKGVIEGLRNRATGDDLLLAEAIEKIGN